jgi:hypothetical protein
MQKMSLSKTKEFLLRHLTEIEATVFFAAYYLSVLLIIKPELIYYASGRVIYYYPFTMDSRFLYDSLTAVGGPVNYLASFFSQCFYFSWIGALIITAIGWLFWLLSQKAFAVTRSNCITETCFLFPILLLAAYASYNGHKLLIALSLLVTFAAFVVYLWTDLSRSFFSAMLFLAEFACLYYLVGGAVFIFGLLAALYELLAKRRIVLAGGIFAVLALYYIGVHLGDVSEIPPFCLMYIPPFLILLQIARYKRSGKKPVPTKSLPDKDGWMKRFRLAMLILRKMIPYSLILFVFCVVFNDRAKSLLQIWSYAEKQDWQKVLECATRYPESQYNIFFNYDINRALYYTGRLGDDMFSYHQNPFALLLSMPDSGSTTDASKILCRKAQKVDILMELGYLGHARRCASEALELANGCPYLVKKLALIYLAEGQNETAKIYLGALSKDLIYGRFARQLLLRLEKDPQLTDYEPVQSLRRVAVQTDHVGDYDLDNFFTQLLQRNPHNKMAFEYMMAMYLLTGQVDKIALNISRMDEFEYNKMPRHYEEAMLVYAALRQQRFGEKINLQDLSISSETIQRFQKYNATGQTAQLLYGQRTNPEMIRQYLAKDFRDTYMFYLNFELPRIRR